MVKVTSSIAVVLLICFGSTDAWFGGGSSNKNNDSGDNKSKEKGTTVDTSVETSKDGGTKGTVGVTHEGDGWSGKVEGSFDDKGNWGGKVSVSKKLRKRSIAWNGELYTVSLDPCNFGVYDGNKDGVIVKSEMTAIFGENTNAGELFEALDITTGDGRIEEDEFYFMSAVTINECQDKDQRSSF